MPLNQMIHNFLPLLFFFSIISTCQAEVSSVELIFTRAQKSFELNAKEKDFILRSLEPILESAGTHSGRDKKLLNSVPLCEQLKLDESTCIEVNYSKPKVFHLWEDVIAIGEDKAKLEKLNISRFAIVGSQHSIYAADAGGVWKLGRYRGVNWLCLGCSNLGKRLGLEITHQCEVLNSWNVKCPIE